MTMPAMSIPLIILSSEPKTMGTGPIRRIPPNLPSVSFVGRPLSDRTGALARNILSAPPEKKRPMERDPRKKDARMSMDPMRERGPRNTKTGDTTRRYTSPSPCLNPWNSKAAPTVSSRRARRVGTLMPERAVVLPLTFARGRGLNSTDPGPGLGENSQDGGG